MKKLILSALALALTTTFAFAQVNQNARSFPNRADAVTGDQARNSAIEGFMAEFAPQEAGILHVYASAPNDPAETYLFRGQEASGTTLAMLPVKFQQKAKQMGAKVYATKAIKLMGVDDHYLVRMDGTYEDRIEMFKVEGNTVKHVKTLATDKCYDGMCDQTDTWITDIDGDTDSELIQISRTMRAGETTSEKQTVYTHTKNGKWKKSRKLAKDAPWTTIEFHGKK